MFQRGFYSCKWILIAFVLNRSFCSASHFQGASASWTLGDSLYDTDEDSYRVGIDFRIAWRRSTETDSPDTFCDLHDVATSKEIGHGSLESYEWKCLSGCTDAVTAGVKCTEFDEEDNWSLGVRTEFVTVKKNEAFIIAFTGCCWISTLVYATPAKWNATVIGTLAIRSDTGLPNRSPVSAVTPVIRFQAGCPDSVDLLMYDEDHDNVTCRFAECSEPDCYGYPYLKLSKQGEKCRLSYNAGGPGNTDVAITIILEDYPANGDVKLSGQEAETGSSALSSTPLQFIVRVHEDIRLCNSKPTWLHPTFPNGFVQTVDVNANTTIELRISSTYNISVINAIGPHGLNKSAVIEESSGTEYSATLTFLPESTNIGPNIICITAKDEKGKMSEQRCAVYIVGDGHPCQVDNGGCSDKCVANGSSYQCTCSRPCWDLGPDGRTCIPIMKMECHHDRFEVNLPICAVGPSPFTIGYNTQTSIVTPECEADIVSTNYTKDIPFDECLTQIDEDFLEVHYYNNLRMFIDVNIDLPGSGEGETLPITRGFYYNIQLVCSFNKYANVNTSFRPQDQQEGSISIPGLGSFQFFFDFYMNENFQLTYSPYAYPITVTVNSDIYFGIKTIGGTGMEVFTEKCVAMTSPSPAESTASYTMIEDGCVRDLTMKAHDAPSKMEDRYSIKAFRFQDNLNIDGAVNIYIQCSAVLCVIGEATRCQRGCISSRKRRDENDQVYIDHSIHTRRKRQVEDDTDPTSFIPNVTESNSIDIVVSGPFRIDVIQTEGTPLVTVVTPTNIPITDQQNDQNKQTSKPISSTSKEIIREAEKEPDSMTIIVIASSVGGVLFFLLLVLLIGLVAYYHFALKSRHKVLPDKRDVPSRSSSAWTVDDEDDFEEVHVYSELKTPPPSFWDVQRIT